MTSARSLYLQSHDDHPVYSSFEKKVARAGAAPVELIKITQSPFEGPIGTNDTFCIAAGVSPTGGTMDLDYGDGVKEIISPAGVEGVYLNPTGGGLMAQKGTFELLGVICPIERTARLLGMTAGTVRRAVEPLHERLAPHTFEADLIRAMWYSAEAHGPMADLFVDQAFMTLALSLMRMAEAGDAGLEMLDGKRVAPEPTAFDVGITCDDPRLGRVIEFIEANLHATITLDALASEVALSAAQLTRLFKAHRGTTPARYVTARRLERARELLVRTNRRIDDIAWSCGFGSTEHFSRTFAQAHGEPPSRFRSAAR